MQGFSEQWEFTKWLYIKNISGYIRMKADQVIIGKVLGSHNVGLYSMANELANLPASELIYPAATPIYSGYAKLVNDVHKLNSAFIAVIGVISVIAFPLLTGMYVLAEELVRVALGTNWLEIVPILKLSVILALVQLYFLAFSTLLMVNSKGIRILTFIDCGYVIVLVPLLFYLSRSGDLFAVLLGRILLALIIVLLLYIVVLLICHVKFGSLLRVIIRPFFVSLCMKMLLEKIDLWMDFTSDLSELFYKTIIGGAFYVISIMLLWIVIGKAEGGERFIIYNIKNFIK
jgi:O-antigen/teichoic acid export membrane protein